MASLKRWRLTCPGETAMGRRGRDPRRGPLHRGAQAQGEGRNRPDLPCQLEQLRRDLTRRRSPKRTDAEEGDRVHRHRSLQVRRVGNGQPHPDGPLRRLRPAPRAGERLRGTKWPTWTRSAGSPRRTSPARVAALESGDVDFADDLQPDAFEKIRANARAPPDHLGPLTWEHCGLQQEGGAGLQPGRCARPSRPPSRGGRHAGRRLKTCPLPPRLGRSPSRSRRCGTSGPELTSTTRGTRSEPSSSCGRPATRASRFAGSQPRRTLMYNIALVTKQQLEDIGNERLPPGGGDPGGRWSSGGTIRRCTTSSRPGSTLVPDPTQHPYPPVRLAGLDLRQRHQRAHGHDPAERLSDKETARALGRDPPNFDERVPATLYGDLLGLRAMKASV